jgi:phospholipid/cholesterol/gamma-HCH transport system substrate-binding protein
MENRSHALMAGLFTLLLGLAAAASIVWFGGKREATKDYMVVSLQNVTGLSPQGSVRYRGMSVGKVQSIALDPQDVRNILIRINVNDSVPITRGTTAKIGYQGVTGIAHIQLEESRNDATPLLGEGGELPRLAMQPSLIEELSAVGGEALYQARDVLASLNQVLNAKNRQNITQTLANLEATTAAAQATILQLRPLLSAENLRVFKSALVRTDQAVGQAGPFFAEARVLVGRLQAASDKFEAALGDSATGGAGALAPRLNELSLDLSSTSRQLERVLQHLEYSPQSLVFGTPSALPGPGEAGFALPMVPAHSEEHR